MTVPRWSAVALAQALGQHAPTPEQAAVIEAPLRPLLVVAGAAGLGLVMGTVLGVAQAAALRGAVPHPRRWVAANAAAWPLAMVVIFLGATTPSAGWPAWSGASA